MRAIPILAAIAIAFPAVAIAQVGPNPAATGGSLDPTVGAAGDPLTSPQDSGSPAMRTRSSAIGDPATGSDVRGPSSAGVDSATSSTATVDGPAGATTTSGTRQDTKSMAKATRRR